MKNLEKILELTERLIGDKTGNSLSFIQKIILRESLSENAKTYGQIALENNYSEKYVRQWLAPKLWQLLSTTVGEKVTRANCRAVLKERLESSSLVQNPKEIARQYQITLEPPEGQVPLASPLYIKRASLEATCYQEINQPGAFIRIKAPRKMGKTSLMARILAYGDSQNYHTVRLSLHRAGTQIFALPEKFLRWFCINVTRQLGLQSKLDEYWDEDMGALVSSTIYFQWYLLNHISHPIIIALDEVNHLFEYPDLVRDFFGLLRSWYDETKDIKIWQKLRIVIVDSTENNLLLKINQSPFNVGLVIELPAFTQEEVEDLAQRHSLELASYQVEQLMELTGGFPYLVRLALYHSVRDRIPIENLLKDAATNTGIFSKHLQEQSWHLKKSTELVEAFKQIINTNSTIKLDNETAFKLKNLGLVYLEGNEVRVSCGLYREYFRDSFS
jgi:AAA-like domain